MIKLQDILLLETDINTCGVPNSESSINTYLTDLLINDNTIREIFNTLNNNRSKWTDQDYDNAMQSGACEAWNDIISTVLGDKGIKSQVYYGEPKDPRHMLPQHYYSKVGNTIIDFVAGQFWGYGLGQRIDDADKVTFTPDEYSDILKSYNWTII